MKKLLIASNILFLCIIFFQSCNNEKTDNNCTKRVSDYSQNQWKGRINAHFANMISVNYKSDNGKKYIWNGEQSTGIEDASSIWFGLETMKQFIWEIESRTCMAGCSDSLGIRFYYAKYLDSSNRYMAKSGIDIRPDYANRHTLFGVPTYFDFRLNRHIDFDPWGDGCRKPFDTATTAKPGLIFFKLGGEASNAQNHGSLMPPPAGEGTFPTVEN